jgi:hypothetical protein
MTTIISNITGLAHNLIKNHDDKELIKRYLVISSNLDNVIDCRLYMGRSINVSTVYCDLYIHGNENYGSGNGSAGDGYNSATMKAIKHAGIKLEHDNEYCTTIEQALLSIALAINNKLNYKVFS